MDTTVLARQEGEIAGAEAVLLCRHDNPPYAGTAAAAATWKSPKIAADGEEPDRTRAPRLDSAPTRQTVSDADLTERVCAILHPSLNQGELVSATVRAGWLILQGEVETAAQKRSIEQLVRPIKGVRGISNNIMLVSEVLVQRVQESVERQFVFNARRRANRIIVSVQDRRIILSGHVSYALDRDEAETAARRVPGIRSVTNRIRVDPDNTPGSMEQNRTIS
ncbi:MAG TPA: BON domain-containing protein [Rhodopila sp.]|nr:BON domain-containing protein [Rhodopila sp.]